MMTPLDFLCDYCGRRDGAPCVTRFYTLTRPHKSRHDRHASATDTRQRSILDVVAPAPALFPVWTMTTADVTPDVGEWIAA